MAEGVRVERTKIKAVLSEKSLEQVIIKLGRIEKDFQLATEQIITALATYFQERARYYLDASLLHPAESTGRLKNSITINYDYARNVATVYTDLYYAQMVEFGAGRYGSATPYSLGGEGTERFGDVKYNPEFAGQAPHWFWLRALNDLEQNYVSIANKVLEERGLIGTNEYRYINWFAKYIGKIYKR